MMISSLQWAGLEPLSILVSVWNHVVPLPSSPVCTRCLVAFLVVNWSYSNPAICLLSCTLLLKHCMPSYMHTSNLHFTVWWGEPRLVISTDDPEWSVSAHSDYISVNPIFLKLNDFFEGKMSRIGGSHWCLHYRVLWVGHNLAKEKYA